MKSLLPRIFLFGIVALAVAYSYHWTYNSGKAKADMVWVKTINDTREAHNKEVKRLNGEITSLKWESEGRITELKHTLDEATREFQSKLKTSEKRLQWSELERKQCEGGNLYNMETQTIVYPLGPGFSHAWNDMTYQALEALK